MGLNWQHDVWPVLAATYGMLRERGYADLSHPDLEALAESLGRSKDDMALRRIFEYLADDGYLAVDWAGVILPFSVAATARGLRHFEGWPSPDQVDLAPLLQLLDQRIDDPAVPEDERRGLRKIRDAISEAGWTVATSLFTAWLTRLTGIGGS